MAKRSRQPALHDGHYRALLWATRQVSWNPPTRALCDDLMEAQKILDLHLGMASGEHRPREGQK